MKNHHPDGSCCGQNVQPIPTKGHSHAMNFIMLISGLALTYALAAVIVMATDARQINGSQTSGSVSAASTDDTNPSPTEPVITSVEVIE